MYRQSRVLVVYEYECQTVAGQLFNVPVKACQWNHPTLLEVAKAQPQYYSTDYPWSSFMGMAVGTVEAEDPLLCSSQPTQFLDWFCQRWGNLHATAWKRLHFDQIELEETKVVATCVQHKFFMQTYPTFQVRFRTTEFTDGDEAYFIPVYHPHQMLVINDFTALRRQGQDFWMLRRAYQFVPSHQADVWATQPLHASRDPAHIKRFICSLQDSAYEQLQREAADAGTSTSDKQHKPMTNTAWQVAGSAEGPKPSERVKGTGEETGEN